MQTVDDLSGSTSSISLSLLYMYEPDDELMQILENENLTHESPPEKLKHLSVGFENTLEKSNDGQIILINQHKLKHDLRQKS
ncbi:hypothetical protein ILUMI_03068 [Ignelater luminosus]|uniref:Uncharacterized protein n=1 Tax=Ignelater luminosus TaxID=2038154 RepID=A0A8K0GMJ7_IGNLU|nr:hypothetical protein ILUMI_03068 [Ignelater luminosus]